MHYSVFNPKQIAIFFVICTTNYFQMKLASLLLFLSLHCFAGDRLPVPPESPNRLFFIQRSTNINVAVYDANLIGGKLNAKDPVRTYWYKFNEKPPSFRTLILSCLTTELYLLRSDIFKKKMIEIYVPRIELL